MTILGLILSFILPIATAYVALTAVSPSVETNIWHKIFNASLAAILGPALCACLFFVWLITFGQISHWYIAVELAALLVVGCLSMARLYRIRHSQIESLHTGPTSSPLWHRLSAGAGSTTQQLRLTRIIFITGIIIFLLAALNLILLSCNAPHGQWDAWSIWNLRARFLFCGGPHWQDGHSPLIGWSHPDYPLLLPCMVARSWLYMGRESTLAPICVSSLALLATATLTASATALLRGGVQGMLAALAILGADYALRHGASQYADTLLSFWLVAAIATFVLIQSSILSSRTGGILCGLLCGLAAWTKNEGAIFAAIFAILVLLRYFFHPLVAPAISRCISDSTSSKKSGLARNFLWFIVGLVPIACLWLYFKMRIAPPNDLLQSFDLTHAWAHLRDPSRYRQVATYFARNIVTFGGGLPIVLLLYGLLVGKAKHRVAGLRTAILLLALVLAADFFVYILTPQDLAWHLKTSARRLLLQLHPAAVLVFFLLMRSPFEGMSTVEKDATGT